MVTNFDLSQFFAGCALLLNLVRFTRHTRRAIMLVGIPTLLCLAISQAYLQQWQGVALTLASAASATLQVFIGENSERHHYQRLIAALLFGFIGTLIVPPEQNWVTWLPITAYLISKLGEINHSPIRLRFVWLGATFVWGAYAAMCHNWMYLISEIFVFSLSSRYLWRHYRASLATT